MKYADYDYTKYPVVYIKMNPVSPTKQQQEIFFQDFEKIFAFKDKAILIFNSKDQKLISSEARIQAGQWMKTVQENMRKSVTTIIFTEASVWLSMVLKAIFMISKPPVPMHVVKDLDEAKQLIAEKYPHLHDIRF
jgi:hypothetical protein